MNSSERRRYVRQHDLLARRTNKNFNLWAKRYLNYSDFDESIFFHELLTYFVILDINESQVWVNQIMEVNHLIEWFDVTQIAYWSEKNKFKKVYDWFTKVSNDKQQDCYNLFFETMQGLIVFNNRGTDWKRRTQNSKVTWGEELIISRLSTILGISWANSEHTLLTGKCLS